MEQSNMSVAKRVTTKETGAEGEAIAEQYLLSKGYTVIERNYWRKLGELDLIVTKNNIVSFVEVKTVSYETRQKLEYAVTHETWRPEEQVHHFKLHQIAKTLELWIADTGYTGDWQIDVIAVRIVPRETYATVMHLENVVV